MEAQVDGLAGRPRVWILFTHITKDGEQALDTVLRDLDERGKRLFERRYDSAAVYLYDLRSG